MSDPHHYAERIRVAKAIAADNNALPEVLRLNPDGSAKHPFMAAFVNAMAPGFAAELDALTPRLSDPNQAVRSATREQLARLRRRMEHLEG